jgi:hypothetical protein
LLSAAKKDRKDLSLPNSQRGKHCKNCGKKISRSNRSGFCRSCRGRLILHPVGIEALRKTTNNKFKPTCRHYSFDELCHGKI